MDLRQILIILGARRWIALLTLVLTVVTTATVSLLLPKSYTATASVIVDVKGADQVGGLVLPAQLTPGYLATQIDVIGSPRVARKVVERLGLERDPSALERFAQQRGGKGSMRDWLADTLLQRLKVEPGRDSSVVNIGFTWYSPGGAAQLANAFSEAYIDTTLELKVEPARQNAQWFNERLKILRTNLEQAQERLSEYQQSQGIIAADERLDVETARLAELSSQLVGAQAARMDSSSRQRQAASGTQDVIPEVLANSLVQGLKADLGRQEAKLEELSSQLGVNHPQYQGLLAEIEQLRARLREETRRVATSLASTSAMSQRREAELLGAVTAQKDRVLALKAQRDDLSVLAREVESAQRTYDVAMQRFTQTSLESESNQANVYVLDPAIEPVDASAPRVGLNIVVAAFLGTLLAVAVALLLELPSLRVRSIRDLSAALPLPLLGSVERAPRPRRPMNLPRLSWQSRPSSS